MINNFYDIVINRKSDFMGFENFEKLVFVFDEIYYIYVLVLYMYSIQNVFYLSIL